MNANCFNKKLKRFIFCHEAHTHNTLLAIYWLDFWWAGKSQSTCFVVAFNVYKSVEHAIFARFWTIRYSWDFGRYDVCHVTWIAIPSALSSSSTQRMWTSKFPTLNWEFVSALCHFPPCPWSWWVRVGRRWAWSRRGWRSSLSDKIQQQDSWRWKWDCSHHQ